MRRLNISHLVPDWSILSHLRVRSLEKTSRVAAVVCPLLALAADYNDRFHFVAGGLTSALRAALPDELFVAYLISVSYAVATLLFDLFCPHEIKAYSRLADYKAALVAGALVENRGDVISDPGFDGHLAILGVDAPEIGKAMRTIIRDYAQSELTPEKGWVYLTHSRFPARLIVTFFYTISVAISCVFVGWTAPKEVFRVHSLADTLHYLF